MGSCKVVGVVNTKVANCRGRTQARETQKVSTHAPRSCTRLQNLNGLNEN